MSNQILPLKLKAILSFGFIIFLASGALAQPQNDSCLYPYDFPVPGNGYATGSFVAPPIPITNATIEAGEHIDLLNFSAGQDSKSLWYRFSIPSRRYVKVTVAQSGSSLLSDDVGYAVYKSDTCNPSVVSGQINGLDMFGNTFNSCVDAGTYLIQVLAKQNAAGDIVVSLQLDIPGTSYDDPATSYDFGVLPQGMSVVAYDVSCLSLMNSGENCSVLSGSYKTSWQIFTMPAHYDFLALMIAARPPGGNRVVGYNIYSGDARVTSYTSLPLAVTCNSFFLQNDIAHVDTFRCESLTAGSIYSLQIFFEDDSEDSIRVGMMLGGVAPTAAPEPIAGLVPPSNQFGTIPVTYSGALSSLSDRLACNSRHSMHPCLPGMPAGPIAFGNTLSAFFVLTIPQMANLYLEASPSRCVDDRLLIRVYKDSLSIDCSNLTPANRVAQFYWHGTASCLDSGDYVIQVLGSEAPSINTYRYDNLVSAAEPDCLFSNLGTSFSLNITASSTTAVNRYSLNMPGAFDTVNGMQPLVSGIPYVTNIDTFGCAPTVRPFDSTCAPGTFYDRVIYREFNISDSGSVGLYHTGVSLWNKIYRGDANALASAQNVFSFPDVITGLDPVSDCKIYVDNVGNRACVIPGTYTTAEWGSPNTVGPVWNYQNPVVPYSPTIIFIKDTSVPNIPSAPEDMGDVLSQLPPTGGTINSSVVYFTCVEDTFACSGGGGGGNLPPCMINSLPATKAIYRQFYLSRESTIEIFSTLITPAGFRTPGFMSLFYGQVSDTSVSLTIVPGFECHGGSCKKLPAGWYTVISYGDGPSYSYPMGNSSNNFVGMGEYVTISICPGAKYNRPFKAAVDSMTHQPFIIEWDAAAGSAGGNAARYYELYSENFGCSTDTPFSSHPINACGAGSVKVAYYVFQLTQPSYLKIYTYMPTPTGNTPMWAAVYNKDIRQDSMLFSALQPVQPCIFSDSMIFICNAQPGVYTLAVYYNSDGRCLLFTPRIWIDEAGISRFDHAAKAYDFGSIPPDSIYHYGKVGDPGYNGGTPSSDIFYCTTCSQPTDPKEDSCNTVYSSNINESINNHLYPDSSLISLQPGYNQIPRRNLWYTFVINGGGTVRVKVRDLTQPSAEPSRFSIYSSDMDATIPFNTSVTAGQSDSTSSQGLVYITSNKPDSFSCYASGDSATFYKDPCCDTRYFILVTNKNELNHRIDVGILLDSVASIPRGNFCSDAVELPLNGAGSASATANITCHTIGTDYGEFYPSLSCPPGASTSDFKSTWFKLNITGVDTMDLQTSISNHTTAQSSVINYRLMSGNCGAMQERSCVQDARTGNTYKCLPPGEYYIQVFTPVSYNGRVVTGTVDLNATVWPHADSCVPLNNCLATSRFIPQFNCLRGDSATFFNYSTYGYDIRYLWNFGYNNQTSTSLAPSFAYPILENDSIYSVTLVTRNVACGGVDTSKVRILIPGRPYVELGNDTTLCTGNIVFLDATTWSGAEYLWNNGAINPLLSVTEMVAGNYIYRVNISYHGCLASDSLRVTYRQTPQVDAEKTNDINCLLGSATLKARGASFYVWNPQATLSDPYSESTVAAPSVPTNYRVIGISPDGCPDTAFVSLNIDYSDGAGSFAVPNAFTPNGDGLNDCFGVSYWGKPANFRLSIFDRWGKRMFYTADPSQCWDGKWNNIPQDPGTYVYELAGEGLCGQVNRKGYVLLIR